MTLPAVLAIETSTAACSAALWARGDVVAHRFEAMARGQSERLAPMVEEVLAEAGRDLADLDLVAVTVGPGAFTGIRIGLSFARGLALAAGLPCLGVTTFDAVAHGPSAATRAERRLVVALDSKRGDVFVQAFAPDLSPLGEPAALAPDDCGDLLAGPVLVAGDAAERLVETLGRGKAAPGDGLPDARAVARLAAERWAAGITPAVPAPLYLRPPDAKAARDGGRLRPVR